MLRDGLCIWKIVARKIQFYNSRKRWNINEDRYSL